MNYQKGKIYKIESHLGPKIYIGSTTKEYLSQRMTMHRYRYKAWKNEKYHRITSFELFDEYGIDNCNIILLELCPCNTKDELTSRESHYIRTLNCVNKVIPDRTQTEYQKLYYETNKEVISKQTKKYYETNKEAISEKKKENYETNKEAILEKQKQPFNCECGITCRIDSKPRHFRSKKHLNFIASKSQ